MTAFTRDRMRAAACAGPAAAGVDFFSINPTEVVAAQRVCASCRVRAECGEYAIAQGVTEGVWGGLTPAQRRVRRAPEASAAGRTRSAAAVAVHEACPDGGSRRRDEALLERELAREQVRRERLLTREQAKTTAAIAVERKRRSKVLAREQARSEKQRRQLIERQERLTAAAPRLRVDPDVLAAVEWLARYLRAYVPEAGVTSVSKLTTAALLNELSVTGRAAGALFGPTIFVTSSAMT